MATITKNKFDLKKKTEAQLGATGTNHPTGGEGDKLFYFTFWNEPKEGNMRIEFTPEETQRLKRYLNENF